MKSVQIDNSYSIGLNKSTFIIAEAGVNHHGKMSIAKELIDAAAQAGVDAVKFQTFTAENVVSKKAEKAKYQQETTDKDETQYDMLKKFELNKNQHQELIDYADKQDILFLSTPHDEESIDLLNELGLPLFKVGSGDLTNLPYLKKIVKKDKPIILSTGMGNLGEVEDAVDTILDEGNEKLILLHCVSNYPTEPEACNIRAMDTLEQAFGVPVGFSDHTLGIEIPIAAVAMGANVIEKHFTLDKTMEGPDHEASLEPDELKSMVKSIRNVELGLGNGIKKPAAGEKETQQVARKSVVAAKSISKGDTITETDVTIKRPGTGISPKNFERILGMTVNQDIERDEVLKWDSLK